MRKKLLSLLVLLMTAATGAWAEGIVCSASDLGKVLCTDGSIYATLSDATAASKTAAAIIAYVDETNKKGLALALTDEASEMDWATAMSASGAAAHTPVVDGQTWKLPSQDELQLIKNAYGSGTDLNTAIENAGGTAIPTYSFLLNPTAMYWLSTENSFNTDIARTWAINGYDEIAVGDADQDLKTESHRVRACLEFTIEEAAPEPQPAGYAVSLKAETADEGNWTAKAGEGEYQALPLEGVAEGTQVSVKYGGTKKVKSVKAKKKAAAGNPAPTTASIEDYTAGTFGWNGDGSAATNLPTINTFAANDKISILSTKNTNTQFTTSAGGASATFSGTATDDSKFYAVYPYTDGLTLSGDVISGIVIPSIQYNGKWYEENNSAWDPNAPVAYATTTGSSLQFHNLCAILKIKVVGSSDYGYAGKITISADQALAGTFSLDTSTGTLTATEGSTTVDTGDTWDAGHWVYFENNYCYFAIAPGTYSNFKVHTDIWGDPKEDKTKASVTFEKGKIYDLGEFSCN